ncbi:fluoride efflux transporter FluC [Aeromicrobium fastidiosum]|uniref:Fluoride-specific ion channel FluC n=1 Tax=Aeromicrobium fastidiosum TaxID=52699 RepID=A0A641AHK1_9ACTN|nr:CrcB family protein [Aeromicrobium fastidiosum]KAA1373592.1 CrcB family protein [Aeromicrobium fastidiosum]MBP2391139.1 CrcB protein [Aeromicrobium fastidiosum]
MKLFWLVVAGGAAGSLARYGIGEWLNTGHDLPIGTLLVNVTGSFALGALLALLLGRGDDAGRLREARLLLGTGFLGGYTTYSALAVETDTLLRDGRIALGAAYAIGTVALGLLAALAGVVSGRAVAR